MRPEDTQMASGRVEQPSLVERLRQPWPPSHSEDPLMTEAADEITRLAARVAQLEGALERAANRLAECNQSHYSHETRAALTQPAQENPND
jgi:HAMP domain-containing protein